MGVHLSSLRLALLGVLLFLTASTNVSAVDSPTSLTARDSGTPLYAQQDRETEPITRLQKGEVVTPRAESAVAFFSSVFPR